MRRNATHQPHPHPQAEPAKPAQLQEPSRASSTRYSLRGAFACLRLQRLHQRAGEQGHETAVAGVKGCIPGLLHGPILELRFFGVREPQISPLRCAPVEMTNSLKN